jgi:hypothetical protein
MALMALGIPILPGKEEKWEAMAEQLSRPGPMKDRLDASRRAAGVHERTFLQESPQSKMVIVTLEGDDPAGAFGRMMADPALRDFAEWAADVHGLDPAATPPPMPRLVYDSRG